ncbi:histidine kinase [Luteolibacter sp. SL250]|uniref:sensor histidine kinase n=1 Tax=Luteolibacter sp. SL250 TaxID=2995170 RepID=UPI00226FA112|nr:histidine kinase [Luteolibacter sp. SL250]WAC19122.1 histidine kinase [Luteolibacter sp. SL250]
MSFLVAAGFQVMVRSVMKSLERGGYPEETARRRLFWFLQTSGWLGVGLMALYPLVQIFDIRTMAVVLVLRVSSGILVTLGLRWLYRRMGWRDWSWWGLGAVVMMLCVAMGTVDSLGTQTLSRFLTGSSVPQEIHSFLLLTGILLRTCVLMIWSLLYFGIKLWMETAEVKLRAAQSEASARTSELKQLRSQVNPHFLFNALNSILAEKDDPDAVERITQELAGYLRFSLRPAGDCQLLGEEIEALEHYLRVEKARFEEKLVYEIRVSPEAGAHRVPVATVQPLLENAMKYGRKTSPTPLRLLISADILPAYGVLKVAVANTGRWVDEDSEHSHGIGLSNLRRRLELLFGREARLTHTATDDGWVKVEAVIPLESMDEGRAVS